MLTFQTQISLIAVKFRRQVKIDLMTFQNEVLMKVCEFVFDKVTDLEATDSINNLYNTIKTS